VFCSVPPKRLHIGGTKQVKLVNNAMPLKKKIKKKKGNNTELANISMLDIEGFFTQLLKL